MSTKRIWTFSLAEMRRAMRGPKARQLRIFARALVAIHGGKLKNRSKLVMESGTATINTRAAIPRDLFRSQKHHDGKDGRS